MSRHSPSPPRQDEQRPTLPPIRQIFASELSQSVPPHQSRQPSSSPQVPYGRLPLTDDERRYMSQSPSFAAASRSPSHSYPHSYPPLQTVPRPSTPSGHSRHATEPIYRPQPYAPSPPSSLHHPPRGQSHPSMYVALPQPGPPVGTGTYPYSPIPPYTHQPVAGPSTSRPAVESPPAERISARYECSYCGKGFTRPSSLKIHLNTHTGEKPFTCPFEGCGRSFSVQSNMRRHARVHTRGTGTQPELEEDSPEEPEDSDGSKNT
ncbi:hypothetical protein B0H21DRAFT_819950 [Amylocystis lapponica]|nr:hypothetical protein B0H21DRAFT_819950 [Amylocystis lapponica]